MPLRRLAVCTVSVLAALVVASAASATPAASTATTCPGTFQVLNNDHVGSLSLPAGPYVITTSGKLSCTQASSLFTTFLNQLTGNLPDGWKVASKGFRKGSTSFTVALIKTRNPVPVNTGNKPAPLKLTCPGTFSVLHNDKIGSASYPAGNYVVTLLRSSTKFSCQDATREFALFLGQYSSGRLPRPWTLTASTLTFRTPAGIGFRTTVLPGATPGSGETNGGGETQGALCSATYTVSNDNTRIDDFVLDKGKYAIWTIGGLTCDQAAKDVARLVALRTSLPRGWKHEIGTAIITVGGGKGLRLKLDG